MKKSVYHRKFVILGAGLSGLCVSYFLQSNGNCDFANIEKNDRVGGLCASHNIGGYYFDYTGHLLHSKNPFVINFIKKILNRNLIEHKRNSAIRTLDRFVPYPFQFNLSGLPTEINIECLAGFIENYYKIGETVKSANFDDWMKSYFGAGIYKYFMKPYNAKFWRTNLKKLTTDWFDKYIPQPSLYDMLKSAVTKNNQYPGYNFSFYYPLKKGIGALV